VCIDGQLFLFGSGTNEASGNIDLTAGYHKIEYYHREWSGGEGYYFYWKKQQVYHTTSPIIL
jgi:hypothetical protein